VRIVIAGGTGFLGRPLASALARHGHEVGILTRRSRALPAGHVTWNPDGHSGAWASALEGVDAVVNLAGESIAGGRWTSDRKRTLLESRLLATRSLVSALRTVAARPRVFVNASGVGYYGARGDEEIGEDAPPGTDFLAGMSAAWEAEAAQADEGGTRVIVLRNGLVLAPDGGVLGRLLLPFKLGLGGVLGDGRQYVPWIHRRDWIDLVRWSLITGGVYGTFNATAPEPVTNRELTERLAEALHRPHVFRVPPFALRFALGEIADTLLTGQRAVPRRALAQDFHFRWPSLAPALRNLLS
jgi:uncharacterized protein (TIGR01777 family)